MLAIREPLRLLSLVKSEKWRVKSEKWKVKSEEWKIALTQLETASGEAIWPPPTGGREGVSVFVWGGLGLLYHSYKHGADEEMVDGHEGVAFVMPVRSPWVFADEVEDGVACGFVGDVCHSGYCHGVLVCYGVLLECFLP